MPKLCGCMQGDVEGSKEYHLPLGLAGKKGRGGFRATMFVYGLVALDSMGFVANTVFALAIRNRRLPLPKAEELYEISDKETIAYEEKLEHTEQFRFLDKAAILPEGMQPAPWKVCSVTQVEEVKILTRLMLPILGSTIIMNTCLEQLQTFSEQQGNDMYRKIGKHDFPAPSAPFTGHPAGITQLQLVGVGLVLSAVSMAVAGIVEVKRRDQALKAILSCLNFLLYLYSASWYRYKPDDTESNNKPKAKDSDEGLLLAKESSGAKKDEEESEQNAAKRNEEESAQETDDAEAKAPSSEQSNGTK
ncbi:hypothetical protein NC653_012558 [Populus alba x Populus x berolinensis]|uniref:Uncharacterized protein n=1 Tax=Populus alba x Populus x berolinensis TaxID=444605 RepID=A0AAD6W289_9ROSI|nr:hypothetical protein NC653_012558 [Populus alba x Populus x berolinensis]